MTDTETLDRLYLEWSQFTGARTKREIAYEAATHFSRSANFARLLRH